MHIREAHRKAAYLERNYDRSFQVDFLQPSLGGDLRKQPIVTMLILLGTHDQYRAVGMPYNFLGVGSDKVCAHRWTMRSNNNEISPPSFRFSKNLVVHHSRPRRVRETSSWNIGFLGHLLELRTGGIFALGADVWRQKYLKAVRDFWKNRNHSNCSVRQCRELHCEKDSEFSDRCFGGLD